MGIAGIGIPSLILIIVLALIIFGPNKLPAIGKAAGQTLREFKNSTSNLMEDTTENEKNEENETKDTDSDRETEINHEKAHKEKSTIDE